MSLSKFKFTLQVHLGTHEATEHTVAGLSSCKTWAIGPLRGTYHGGQ